MDKDIPRIDGISFRAPDIIQSKRIEDNLKKIIRKAGEISEDLGIEKEEIYKKIDFNPVGFMDEYSRNFDDYENFLPPEEYSDLVVKELEDLKKEFDDPEPDNEPTYGEKIKRFLKGKGKAILTAGMFLSATVLTGCLAEAHEIHEPQEQKHLEDSAGDSNETIINDNINMIDSTHSDMNLINDIEFQKENNSSSGLPDLVVDDITLTWYMGRCQGHETVDFTVKNIGTEKSKNFKTEIRMKKLLQSPSHWPWIRDMWCDGLKPGEKAAYFMHRDGIYGPRGPGGLLSLVIAKGIVDPDNRIKESNESNNEFTSLWYTVGVWPFLEINREIWNSKEGFEPFKKWLKDKLERLPVNDLYE